MKRDERYKHRLDNYQREGYDYTKARYSLPGMMIYSSIRTLKFEKILRTLPNNSRSVLDVGCGTGVLIKSLFKRNKDFNFTGLDFSQNMLDHTILDDSDLSKCKLIQGDAFNLPFGDGAFDAVISSRFIHQYDRDSKSVLIKEMKRVIKPGGILIVEFYSFLPRLIRYPLHIFSSKPSEYFKHCLLPADLEYFFPSKHGRENLVLPFPHFLVKLFGLKNFKQLSINLSKKGFNFFFDQFLIYTRV